MSDLVRAVPVGDDRLAELTAQFLAGRKSDHTRAAYHLDLSSWLTWCRDAGLHPTDAWAGDVMLWLATLDEAGTTKNRRLSAVSSWYRWLIRHRAAERNPTELDRAEKPTRSPRRAPALSDAQGEALLTAADADPNPRSAAIVWLLLTTGIRVGELIAADETDVSQDVGVTVLHVHGKGGKVRPVELEPHTYSRLLTYLASRTDVERLPALPGQPNARSRPLIATATGRRIERKDVRRLIRRLGRKADLPEILVAALTPHATRATQITASLAAGISLRDVQHNAGHASPLTTEMYDRSHWSPDRSPARAVARRFHADRIDAIRDGADPERS